MRDKFKFTFWFFISFILLSINASASKIEEIECQRINHTHCDRVGDFCHHKEEGLACLAKKILVQKDLLHFMKKHLGDDISKLDLRNQTDLDSTTLSDGLVANPRASALIYLNLAKTQVGYSGIIELLKSAIFGKLRNDYPKYDSSSGLPVSIIKIEIAESRAFEQYKNGKFQYPLPVIKDFTIIYGHRCDGKPSAKVGYKKIKLLNNGKELKDSYPQK